jgi:hypothetical protein
MFNLAEFICGGGVRVVILYPWRKDLIQDFGITKPSRKTISEYLYYCPNKLTFLRGRWILKWTKESLRRFFIHMILHDIGHHVERYFREWSKETRKLSDEFADQYAYRKQSTENYIFDYLSNNMEINSKI